MPACPNCGRQTLRTKDWACQWCGYPLLSRAYKIIDKTFRELQEERSGTAKASLAPEPEPGVDLDAELELAKEPPPPQEPAPEPEQRFKIAPEPPPKPETAEPLPEIPPTPDVRYKPKAAFKLEREPEPEPESEPVATAESASAPGPEPPPAQIAAPGPAPQLEERPRPEPQPEPEPPPVVAPSLESIGEDSVLTVDELDALFSADRAATHAKLTGKTIVIKGFVEKVFIRDHIDVRYVMLTGARKKVLWPVRCNFGKESINRMDRLNEGQEVSMRGKYDNYGKNIIFKDCVPA